MWINKEKWVNELWCGDNIEVLKNIPDESVDLIYIDPPFFSNRHYEIIWGNGAELRSFGDRWKGGIEHYVGWMVARFKELHRVLKPTGSIYVHLDWHAVHYLKVELDKIFGYQNFKNEIIWKRSNGITGVKGGMNQFARLHDTLLWYQKNNDCVFNPLFTSYAASTLRMYKYKDKRGKFRLQMLRNYSAASIRKFKKEGRIYKDKNGKLHLKQYLFDKKGVLMSDVWPDIPYVQKSSKENLGYPTQKPEALLERIIMASSHEGAVVLDAFCGCGTTLAVAEKLNRKWICIDVSPVAVKVMTERLKDLEKKLGKKAEDFITIGLPAQTVPQLRKWSGTDFQDFIIEQIDGKPAASKVHDYGIDGFTADKIPIQVKNSERIGRNVIDNFQSAIRRVNSKKGKIYAVTFGRGAVEEAARLKNEDGINIELIELKPFLVQKYGDHTHHQ